MLKGLREFLRSKKKTCKNQIRLLSRNRKEVGENKTWKN